MDKIFCENLKKLRASTGMTQKEFSAKVGVAKSTYALYETGQREPSLAAIRNIVDTFGVSMASLLGHESQFEIEPGIVDDERERMYALKVFFNDFDYDLTLLGDMYQLRGDNGFNDVEKEDLDSIFSSAASFVEVEARKLDKKLTKAMLYAAHERTDTEYSDAKQAHDDTVMDGEDF